MVACEACAYEYNLWSAILEQSADDGEDQTCEYGDRVFAALGLEGEIEAGFIELSEITAIEREDLRILKVERQRLEALRAWEQAEKSKAAQTRHG